jgi:sialic acid synthase SpsE
VVNNIVTIGQKLIGSGERPYFIAELSGNHNGSLDRALALVEAAARAGADAVKLQTYTADTMTLDCSKPEFIVQDPNSPWHGRTLYELYSEAHTPWAWHEPIFDRVRKLGMTPLSTPFDSTAVDFLESLGLEWYKIASFELTDHLLLRYVARTGKPMILSTGMATLEEIAEAVNIVRTFGCPEVILLKCTSAYPANPKDINLLSIPDMRPHNGSRYEHREYCPRRSDNRKAPDTCQNRRGC